MNFDSKLYSKCLMCGKTLVNYESKQRGYGNCCWKKFLRGIRSENSLLIKEGQNK